jgi:hypothetical protein
MAEAWLVDTFALNENVFVVLRPGLPATHLAKCIDALMSIAEHDPNCPKQPRECMDMTRLVAQQILSEVLESKDPGGPHASPKVD